MSSADVLPARLATARAKSVWEGGIGLPRLYSESVAKRILIQLAIIIIFIELIFLTEKLNAILQAAIDHHVRPAHVSLLLLYTIPQISDLALPMGIMIAVYRVAVKCREDREFLVLAGMGLGIHQFVWLALAIGAGAMTLSLIISGFVDPRAQFAHRTVLFEAQHHALRGGITPGQFYFFGKYTVFASPQSVETAERRLFLHENNGNTQRVIGAARASLGEPDAEGHITLHLYDVAVQEFRYVSPTQPPAGTPCPECAEAFLSQPLASARIREFAQELKIDQLLRFEPRGRVPAEWNSLQLLGFGTPPKPIAKAHLAEAGRRFARSLMCLLVPLIAGVAVALTTRVTQSFALPAACAGVMCFDLACTGISNLLAPTGLAGVLIGITVIAIVLAALLMRQAVALQSAMIRPALTRA